MKRSHSVIAYRNTKIYALYFYVLEQIYGQKHQGGAKNTPTADMTVGEVAKKIGVTVRTLRFYDKEG